MAYLQPSRRIEWSQRSIDVVSSADDSMLGVERSGFDSSVLLEPRFPAALENDNILNVRFISQPFCHVAGSVTAFGAAINNDFLIGRPIKKNLGQQFIPPVLIQRQRAGNVIARELLVRPGIHPYNVSAPSARLIDSN